MIKRHLIAIDVDGTLLDRESHLSASTRTYLRERALAGEVIVLSSGRPYRSLEAFYRDIGLQSPIVCYNGALIFIPGETPFPIFKEKIKKEDIRAIASKGIASSLMCESGGTAYIDHEDEYLRHYFPYEGIKLKKGPLEKTLKEDAYTALFKVDDEKAEALRKEIESHPGLKYRHWRGVPYAEAFKEGVDKGAAIRYLMTIFALTKDDVIAFGDSDNDFTMLQEAGHPFAMAGCHSPLLLKSFPSTKKGNDQDGVIIALKELLDA